MIRLCLLLLSLLPLNPNLNGGYHEIIEATDSEETVLSETGIYVLTETDGQYRLSTQNREWSRDLPVVNRYQMVLKEENCCLFYLNRGLLHVIEYNPSGKMVYDADLLDNPLGDVFSILYQKQFYLAGTVKSYQSEVFTDAKGEKQLGKNDAVLIRLNSDYRLESIRIFGGTENESFEALLASDGYLYCYGRKDPLSGGDFGFGGTKNQTGMVVRIDGKTGEFQYQILSTDGKLLFLEAAEGNLYLATADILYRLGPDLSIRRKTLLPEPMRYGFFTLDDQIVLFASQRVYLYSATDFSREYQKDTEILKNAVIRKESRCYLIQTGNGNYRYDIADFRNFRVPAVYLSETEESLEVRTLFGEAALRQKTGYPVFDPLVWGDYEISYRFENAAGMAFSALRHVRVPKKANVRDGMIYPVGYCLEFTGHALLNSQSIVNNHRLDEPGDYVLELTGADGTAYAIAFTVDSEQIRFQELATWVWDREVACAEEFYLDFTFVADEELDIRNVVINEKTYEAVIFDKVNKTLSVRITAPEVPGIYAYHIASVSYATADGRVRVSPIDKTVLLNVLRPVPEAFITQRDLTEFEISLNDPMNTARYFEVRIYNDNEEEIVKYGLSSRNLLLNPDQRIENARISLSLIYDLGNRKNGQMELFDAVLRQSGNTDIGDIELSARAETLQSFQILFEPDSVEEISFTNQILYTAGTENLKGYAMMGMIAFVVFGAAAWLIRKKNPHNFRKQQ